ncbi:PREDICTED: BAG family molecular chaperone regulator 6 [Populus euphratica]|uniref:BAG family molecular chaperone regulator 6 n=1 Tax=Populus euphratica TaxID=75702 RepID=A0AAJ6U5Y7_POPEU|nr:PREDICTED: BAG family molecular chaperone regulator 6 [Populus euphratica]
MMPVYRYMDSHPMRGDHAPPMQHYHPSIGAVSPHMHVDPSKSAAPYGLCPYGNIFGYSVPCHACCGHGNFTGYYGPIPSCSHFPPPQYQCYGYPPYHETMPVQYVPSPNYSMEQPRHEYDKVFSSNNHCCGCRSRTHDQKRDESVKVEELDPDSQKKEGDALVPFQVKNYPYPFMWIPPDKIKNEKDRKPVDSEMASGEKASPVMKPPKTVKPPEEKPRVWNGWVPLDLKSFGPFMQAEDQKRTQNHQNEDELQQFPFPIFWLPPYNKQNDTSNKDGAQTIASSKPEDEPPSAVKFFPVKLPGSGDGSNNLLEGQYNSRDQGSSGTESTPVKQMELHGEKEGANQKSIPVQQMEAFREKEDSEGMGKRGRTASLKNAEGNPTGNSSETCAKRQSLASPKASKLPPVCLRVDPLPKKKNGNSGSRSPSPPGSKGQLQEASKDTSKPSASSGLKANIHHDPQVQNAALSSGKELEANKRGGKIIEVVERGRIENKDGEARNESRTQTPVALTDVQKEVLRNPKAEEAETHDDKYVKKEEQGARDAKDLAAGEATKSKEVTDATRSAIDENKEQRKNLSDEAAALLIQSAYRGFEVRRWEPLKKLKQIAKVQEQVVVVRDKIYALESSSDLQKDDQQRAVIGEMIMSLLLKLDSIQGLHPTIRDIRKSLARELVALQEKLDSLIMKKCEETSAPKNSEDHLIPSSVITAIQDAQKMELGEQPGYCLSQMVDSGGDSEDKETSKSPIVIKEEHRESENEGREVEIDGGSYVAEQENKVGSGGFQSSEVAMTENGQETSAIEQSVLSQSQESAKEEIRGILPENMCCSPHNKQEAGWMKLSNVENSPEVKGTEAPAHEISGKVGAISDKEEECGTELVAVKDGEEMESNASWSSSTANSPDSTTSAKTIDVNLLQEFPSGLIDDEAPEKLDNSNIQENEVRCGGDNKDDTEPSSLKEVIIPIELQHQCMEVLKKGAFLAESEDSVKVGPEKDDSHEDAMVGVCAQQPQALDVKNDEEKVEIRGQEKVLCFSREQEESNEEKQKDDNSQTEHSCSSELANKIFSQEEEVQAEEENDNDCQPLTDCGNEEMKLEVKQSHDLRVLSDNDAMEDRLDGSETTKSLSMIGPNLSQMRAEHDEEKGEELPASSTAISSQVSADEQGMGIESQRKLVDENEKLREMMELLMETGKDQLTVISNLTERVKDLEKKLTRKKKVWAKRFRTASPPSSARPSVKSPRRKAGVAT